MCYKTLNALPTIAGANNITICIEKALTEEYDKQFPYKEKQKLPGQLF